MKKLPKVFANSLSNIQNNKKVFYSNHDKEVIQNEERKLTGKTIEQKIQEIFNSTNYIYKADVDIILDNGTITKKIIGRNRYNLITMDNELIPINSIRDIKYK